MLLTYAVTADEDPLYRLFTKQDNGKLAFGIGGESKANAEPHDVLQGEVEFRDYIMEGFVTYFVRARRSGETLLLSIRKTGSNRDQHLDWSFEHYFKSQGCRATRS